MDNNGIEIEDRLKKGVFLLLNLTFLLMMTSCSEKKEISFNTLKDKKTSNVEGDPKRGCCKRKPQKDGRSHQW